MPRRPTWLLLLSLIAASCVPGSLTIPPVSTLENTTETLSYQGSSLALRSELTRMQTDAGPAITARLRVVDTRGQALPEGLAVDGVFFLFDGAVWSRYLPEGPSAEGDHIEAVLEGGPRWPPGEVIDVVVRIQPPAGQSFLLRQADVTIGGN